MAAIQDHCATSSRRPSSLAAAEKISWPPYRITAPRRRVAPARWPRRATGASCSRPPVLVVPGRPAVMVLPGATGASCSRPPVLVVPGRPAVMVLPGATGASCSRSHTQRVEMCRRQTGTDSGVAPGGSASHTQRVEMCRRQTGTDSGVAPGGSASHTQRVEMAVVSERHGPRSEVSRCSGPAGRDGGGGGQRAARAPVRGFSMLRASRPGWWRRWSASGTWLGRGWADG